MNSNESYDIRLPFKVLPIGLYKMAIKHRFNLALPIIDHQVVETKKLRRKFLSIVCSVQNETENQDIVDHLQYIFKTDIKYLCLASIQVPNSNNKIVYIQLIFNKIIHRNDLFMHYLAGLKCNYHVTFSIIHWNDFLKIVGNNIEFGEFSRIKYQRNMKCLTEEGSCTVMKTVQVATENLPVKMEEIVQFCLDEIFKSENKQCRLVIDIAVLDQTLEQE